MTVARVAEQIDGVAHIPDSTPRGLVMLTHGAGGNRDGALLVALCDEWAARGWLAIRYNLPYRRRRPKGPPSGSAAADRAWCSEGLVDGYWFGDAGIRSLHQAALAQQQLRDAQGAYRQYRQDFPARAQQGDAGGRFVQQATAEFPPLV